MQSHPRSDDRQALRAELGARTVQRDDRHGAVDVLVLDGPLATAAAEKAIQARIAAVAALPEALIAPVHRLDRCEDALQVVSTAVPGVRMSALLEQLATRSLVLTDAAMLELIARVIRAVSELHAMPGRPVHGALTPAHVVLTADGIVLTDAVYGSALEALQWNRDRLWRSFGLVLPTAPSVIHFDQRADVTQLGAVALAIALRRPLHADEYPRAITDLVAKATERLAAGSAMRMWFQQALQLHPRATFDSAVDAGHVFAELLAGATGRRAMPRVVGNSAAARSNRRDDLIGCRASA
jgi:hypothetical protein